MAKILMIVAQNGFRDEELFVPKELLEKAGHKVKVASINRSKATGSMGAVIVPDMGVYEANPDFFDVVIIVGGPGSPALSENNEVLHFVERMNAMDKIVAAICLGPMTLAKAGVLGKKKATVFRDRSAVQLLRESGAVYLMQSVVKDENIVTGDSPDSAEEFGKAIIAVLKERS